MKKLVLLLFAMSAAAQVYSPMPWAKQQFLDSAGKPLAGGCIAFYAAQTTTPQNTYNDSLNGVPNPNPYPLDAGGFGTIWFGPQSYKVVAYAAPNFGNDCNTPGPQQWSVDNVNDAGLLLYTKAVLLSPTARAEQDVVGPLGADYFVGITPHKTSTGVRVGILDPISILDAANPVTLTTANPANTGQTYTIPDPAAPTANFVLNPNGSTNSLDCTQNGLNCVRSATVYFEAGGANGSTAAIGWDTFSTNAPANLAVIGNNITKGAMGFPAAATHFQTATGTGTGSTCTLTYPNTTGTGSLLLLETTVDTSRTVSSVSDGTNSYAKAAGVVYGTTRDLELWYIGNAASKAGGTTVTVTFNGAGNSACEWHEYLDVQAAPLDRTITASGTGTAVSVGPSLGTTNNTELIYSAVGAATAPAISGQNGWNLHSYTAQSTNISLDSQGMIQNVTGTQSASFTLGSSQAWGAVLATFKITVAANVSAQRSWNLPSYYLSSQPVNALIKWQTLNQNPEPSTNTTLAVQTVCTPDGSTDDPAFNSASSTAFPVPQGTAGAITSSAFNAINTTGCGAGNLMHYRIWRYRYDANDNFEGYVVVNGASLSFGISQ